MPIAYGAKVHDVSMIVGMFLRSNQPTKMKQYFYLQARHEPAVCSGQAEGLVLGGAAQDGGEAVPGGGQARDLARHHGQLHPALPQHPPGHPQGGLQPPGPAARRAQEEGQRQVEQPRGGHGGRGGDAAARGHPRLAEGGVQLRGVGDQVRHRQQQEDHREILRQVEEQRGGEEVEQGVRRLGRTEG